MKRILLLIVLLVASSVHASNIDHVNIGRIAVDDQSVRSQQLAGKQALAQVFVKISGNPSVLDTVEIAKAVDNYEQFLISSSFLQQENDWIFEATFNQQKIEQLLMATGLNVWTSLRPSAVLWLAKEFTTQTEASENSATSSANTNSANQRILLSENQAVDLANLVKNQAYQRGVDIIVPLGDLDDAINISVYDVWNQFVSRLIAHSSRYNADYIISATMQPYSEDAEQAENAISILNNDVNQPVDAVNDSANQTMDLEETQAKDLTGFDRLQNPNDNSDPSFDMFGEDASFESIQNTFETPPETVRAVAPEGTTHKLDYVITNRSRVHTGRLFGQSENELVKSLVDKYADTLALEFSLGGSSSTQQSNKFVSVNLVINNIKDLRDYVSFKRLVESVPAVSLVKLEKQESTTAHFTVEQSISKQQLSAILSLDKRVQVDLSSQQASDLQFIWQD